MSRFDKIMLFLLSVLIAFIIMVGLSSSDEQREKDMCTEMCSVRDSEIRVFEPGVCICQK